MYSSRGLQRRARRHATINVVDFSDVRTCQDMVDVSDVTTCQNKHARVFCVCDVTDGQKSLVGTFWSWRHKTSNYVDLFFLGRLCVVFSDKPNHFLELE